MKVDLRTVNNALANAWSEPTRRLFKGNITAGEVAQVVGSADFTVTELALEAPLATDLWDTEYTRALINRRDFGETADLVRIALYLDSAVKDPDSSTSEALLLSEDGRTQAMIKHIMLDPEYPITLDHVFLALSRGGKHLNTIYSCALFQRDELKDLCGYELFNAICERGMQSRNRFFSMGIARNKNFPVSQSTYDLCKAEYNSFFTRGYIGNPSRPIQDEDYNLAKKFRAQNNNEETMFEQGLTEHPEFQ